MKTLVLVWIFSGFADWEGAYLMPELRKHGIETATIALTRDPVRSMGGLNVTPDMALADLNPEQVRALILPGGDPWHGPEAHPELLATVKQLRERHIPVAAICGATVFLARNGFLDDVRHTSNALPYIQQMAPSYQGASLYEAKLAVADQGIVTAAGIGALEFTHELLKLLKVFESDAGADDWYQLFKNGVWPRQFR